MVEDSRFELLTHACKAHVFPISTNPPNWPVLRESNSHLVVRSHP